LFIPDARFLWVTPSVSYLEKYIVENNIETIITSGPPQFTSYRFAKRKLDLTWFADFRDPWTTIGYHKALRLSNYATKKHKMLEHKVLNTADTIIVTEQDY
jgi:hypothetical protein